MIGKGSRVGMLTVEEATAQKKAGYKVWKCRCDCGREILLDARSLQRGMVRDCGCKTMVRPGQKDIAGMRFGKLIAIKPTKERGRDGSTVWLCRCDCGGEIAVALGRLMAGTRKSCGCLSHPPRKEFIGKRFGQLTVVGYAGKQGGMHRWRCQCDCGNETVVGQTLLQNGKTKSCGCLQANIYKENLQLVEGTSLKVLRSIKNGRRIKSNTSGYNGVYFDKRRKRWVAQITFQGKTKYLGSFEALEEAVESRKQAETVYDEFLERFTKGAEGEAGG